MEIKERIKQIRKSKDLTQVEFGKLIGVKGNTITNYETGLRTPTDAVINNICKTFGVNEEWLRTGNGDMFIDMDLEDELMHWAGTVLASESDNFKKRFVRMLSKLSEDEWELLAKMAQELVETEKATDE